MSVWAVEQWEGGGLSKVFVRSTPFLANGQPGNGSFYAEKFK